MNKINEKIIGEKFLVSIIITSIFVYVLLKRALLDYNLVYKIKKDNGYQTLNKVAKYLDIFDMYLSFNSIRLVSF